ncbi:MAG: signal recognition particle-docking protein FtsY [Calditrichaeota bacterium]|nr:MAG: signal recognition particle-docking protein FtsY [Calditrichota bacterium]
MARFLEKFKQGLQKTRTQVFDRLQHTIKAKRKIDDELLDELEEILISGDVGVDTALALIERVKKRVKKEKYMDTEDLLRILKSEFASLFPRPSEARATSNSKPFVILVVGVNGTGKTTSIARLAHLYKKQGKQVLLAAADTFRAAAIEQLQVWADRLGVECIKHKSGSDPSAVVFDALQAARARGTDVVIIDTAGRLHTKVNLMEELKKIRRVIQKVIPDAPHQVLLVLDATIGQNSISQARQFLEAVGVNGIVLTKLDGTAKGGAVLGIAHQLKVPVLYVGLGEGLEDFAEFDPESFVEGLFADSSLHENRVNAS